MNFPTLDSLKQRMEVKILLPKADEKFWFRWLTPTPFIFALICRLLVLKKKVER